MGHVFLPGIAACYAARPWLSAASLHRRPGLWSWLVCLFIPRQTATDGMIRGECPQDGDWSFCPGQCHFSCHLAKPMGNPPIQRIQGSKQLITYLSSAPPGRPRQWSAKCSPTMPGKCPTKEVCLQMQPTTTPLKADKTFSTISPFIFALWAKRVKHSCQTQINV